MKIEYTSLADACYERLKERILNQEMRWGEKLDVTTLAEGFGVSRAPVIRAIERLAFEGLVEVLPNKGSYVKKPAPDDVQEITEVRMAFELSALELAWAKVPVELLAQLTENEKLVSVHERNGGQIPQSAFLEYDKCFHQIIAESAGNRRLLDLYAVIRNQVDLVRTHSYAEDKARNSIEMHRKVIRCLENGELDRARAELRTHIEDVGQDMIELLEQNQAH